MGALLHPVNYTKGEIKWGLVAHIVGMFTFATVSTVMNLNLQSICYINDREFPGINDVLPPGPLAYQRFIYSRAISVVPNAAFILNTWLADGLLVSLAAKQVVYLSYIGTSSSSIVAGLFIP